MIHNTPDQKVAAEVLTEIYKQLGISVTFVELPGKRSLIESSGGELDAEAQRIFEIGELYPSLIRVPTSFISWNVSAFSKDPDFVLKDWSSLKNYRVTMVRGMKYAENGLNRAGVEKVGLLSDVGEMMQLLHLGFIDFAISSEFNGTVVLKNLGLQGIKPHLPSLSSLSLFHYVHCKHIALVPELDQVIQRMKEQGTLAALKEKAKAKVINQSK